jgi:hypothetical protein
MFWIKQEKNDTDIYKNVNIKVLSGYNKYNTGLLCAVGDFKIEGKTLTDDKWPSRPTINESLEYSVLTH